MLLDLFARLSPRARAMEGEIARLEGAAKDLAAALQTQTAAAKENAERAEIAHSQLDLLTDAVVALQARIDALEAELYTARSDQQRSAVLADQLRARLAGLPGPAD